MLNIKKVHHSDCLSNSSGNNLMIKSIPHDLKPARNQVSLNYKNRLEPKDMPLYKHKLVEQVNGGDSDNLLLHGDCLSACAYLKSKNIQVDLVYIDPPFNSGANYSKTIKLKNSKNTELYKEVLYSDKWKKEDYLNWLYERLMAIREVMSESGSIYVHLDWHIGHYVKILLDEVFGEKNFLNEIIWCYTIGGKGKSFFGRKHDAIYWYRVNSVHIFNEKDKFVTIPRKPNSHMRTKKDASGREYQEKTDKKSGKIYKYYIDEGKISEDYWTDIEQLNRADAERIDYNTQKPEKLLTRIISASSNSGMIVADFFSGSGTTCAVANKLNRRFIGCDIGVNAIQTTRDRLVSEKASFNIVKIKDQVTTPSYLDEDSSASISIRSIENKYEVTIDHYSSPYILNKIKTPIKLSTNGLELINNVQFDITKNDTWISEIDLEDSPTKKCSIKGVYLLNTDDFRMKIRNIIGGELILDIKPD